MGPILPEDLSDVSAAAPHNRVIIRACEAEGLTPVEVVSQPGDVLFHDLLTVRLNQFKLLRFVVATHYFAYRRFQQ
jgi:hypothetical protein